MIICTIILEMIKTQLITIIKCCFIFLIVIIIEFYWSLFSFNYRDFDFKRFFKREHKVRGRALVATPLNVKHFTRTSDVLIISSINPQIHFYILHYLFTYMIIYFIMFFLCM